MQVEESVYSCSEIAMKTRYVTSSISSLILATSPVIAQSEWPTLGWPSSTPSELGFDAGVLDAFDTGLA